MMSAKCLAKVDHLFLRPVLHKLFSSNFFIKAYSFGRDGFLQSLAASDVMVSQERVNRPVTPFNETLVFRNDIGNAAGFDKDGTLIDFNYRIGAGFALVGTVLHKAHKGNLFSAFGKQTNPWTPLPNSLAAINSLGLPSKGVQEVKCNIDDFRSKHTPADFPIGVSLMGHPLDEEVSKIEGVLHMLDVLWDSVDFFEINESCPNTEIDVDMNALEHRIDSIVKFRSSQNVYRPIIIKLGDVGDVTQTLRFYDEKSIDALALCNTQKAYSSFVSKIDARDRALYNFYTHTYKGGVSGKPIYDFVLGEIKKAHNLLEESGSSMKLLHVGGIFSPEDVAESRSFSSVVLRQWYTGFMHALSTQVFRDVYPSIVG